MTEETAPKFKIGDCVQLNHGQGLNMNVESVTEKEDGTSEVTCTWAERKSIKTKTFNSTLLKFCGEANKNRKEKLEMDMSWEAFIKKTNADKTPKQE